MEDEVIVFAKSRENQVGDREAGLARFGGLWRQPCYLRSYANAAEILHAQAEQAGSVDELALPIFYLVRHATELALKKLRDVALEINRYQTALGEGTQLSLTPSLTHDWERLVQDASQALTHVGYELPSDLRELAELLDHFEQGSPERSRYSEVRKRRTKEFSPSLPEEAVVPLRDLIARLKQVLQHFAGDTEKNVSLQFELDRVAESLSQRLPD